MDFNISLINRLAICWLAVSLLGSLPYLLSGEVTSIADAFFESASGFSATGATALGDVESYSKGLLIWRSLTQWLGGVGFLIFMAVAASASGNAASGVYITVKAAAALYIAFTLIEAALLMIGGMSLYDAAAHSFATVSTGGFSPYSASIARFGDVYTDVVLTVFMLISATNYNLYYLAIRRGRRSLKLLAVDSELKLFAALAIVPAVLISINLISVGAYTFASDAIGRATIQTVSTLTTTGFVRADFNGWPLFSGITLFMLMIVGSCSSSAGGGLKVSRVLLLFKLIAREIFVRLHPNALVSIRYSEKTVPSEMVSRAVSVFALYLTIVLAGSLLISLDESGFAHCISAVVSALGNVGPHICESCDPLDYSGFSYRSKFLLSLLMIAGKLYFSFEMERINASEL